MIARIALCVFATLLTAFAQAPGRTPDLGRAEGERLAREIIDALLSQPPAYTSNSGVIRVSRGQDRKPGVPVAFEVVPDDSKWRTIYETFPADPHRGLRLTVTHTPGAANQYMLKEKSAGGHETGKRELSGNEAMIPFSASDFWLADLGLEFLHWPNQRVLRMEIRQSQSCYVLESINPKPAPNAYTRVLSWLDIDTVRDSNQPGIIHAEAYGTGTRPIKQFAPKEFRKVQGQWQLRSMEMMDRRTNSRSLIEFDLFTR